MDLPYLYQLNQLQVPSLHGQRRGIWVTFIISPDLDVLCRNNLDNYYAPPGPNMKLRNLHIALLLLANILRCLIGLLFLILVPLLYIAIFRARKKHAMAKGG